MAHHDGVRPHRRQRVQSIHEGFAFRDARTGRRDRNCVGAQALGGDLEAGARARGRLEKEVDDHLSAQRIEPLEGLILEWLKILGAGQNRFDFRPLQLFDAEQSRHQAPVPEAVLSTSSTFSMLSISWNFTSMISASEVCTVRPTNLASMGSSRCPRSIRTKSCTR